MEETEFALGECSNPPLQDDVSDDSLSDISDISDSYISEDDYSDHGWPICSKWFVKTIEAARDLAGNPLDPRKTRSQFHTAFFACEVNIAKKLFMMILFDLKSY